MEIITTLLLLIIAAQVTYLVAVNTKKIVHKKHSRPIFVDTSVLIDGRILAVAESGFIGDTLFIPRSVIGELQFLADNADAEKRSRARHGLDVVNELQKMPDVKVEIFQDGSKAEEGVDERLLKLARENHGVICTIDYNLNKVAQVEGLAVLNVNDLAMSLRMAYLPGEKILLELTQKGQDNHQAVGHLADGTMVVVEHASDRIGKTIEIEFIRSLQTAAGKMMFARPTEKSVKNQDKSTADRLKGRKSTNRPASTNFQQPDTEVPQKPVQVPYHSDNREQSMVNKRSSVALGSQNSSRKRSESPRRPNASNSRNAQAKSHKPRTSAQNEADLIKLVNEQR